jgi:Putative zinc-finger
MNHRLYEDWLFAYTDPSDDTLTPQEAAELRAHLQTCQDCQKLAEAWREVEVQFHRSVEMEPEAGFTQRWHMRQQAELRRLHSRQNLVVLVFAAGGAALLLGSLLVLVGPWLRTPSLLVWGGLYQLITLFSYANSVGEAVGSVLRTTGSLVPLLGWIFFIGLICEMAVLWIVSYRMLTNPRRFVQ